MNNEFDFDKIGKRMPYETPDGFFDKLEDDIWNKVKDDYLEKGNNEKDSEDKASQSKVSQSQASEGKVAKPHKPAKLRLLIRSVIAVAAAVAIGFIINLSFFKPSPTTLNDVDQAFSQLTTADQAYLMNVYQDDVFINE